MSIKILAVDDHEILRVGIKLVIDEQKDMEVIGQADNGFAAVEMTKKLRPDVVVMDVSMPSLNGIEATRQIIQGDCKAKVLILSGFSNEQFVIDILKAGASGYVLKDCLSDELIEAIYTVYAGKKYLCSKAADVVVESITRNSGQKQKSPSPVEKLTNKECQMLKLVAQGFSGKQISNNLGISIKTVDGRKRSIMKKLDLHNIADLTKFAIKERLVTLDCE
jgi:DNA-binding NarL/FixJ family response regulator